MISGQPYPGRREAGKILATHLRERFGSIDPLVLALPRGGVPVGFEVARAFEAPLDVFVVRKLGVPWRPELAMGAIATGGYELLNHERIAHYGVTPLQVAGVADREMGELRRREAKYRAGRPALDPRGRVTFLVDDGLATGCTMRAAIGALREFGPREIIVAAPVGSEEACTEILREADELICPFVPDPFDAVGVWYRDFSPTIDDEVVAWLAAGALIHDATHAAHR
jgi:predicted phosphoribosyltransferase